MVERTDRTPGGGDLMANKRMFTLDVVDTDDFLDMSTTARLLYYDLGMRADDDGFLQDVKKIMRFTGASSGDIKSLIEKGFVIPFDSGVVVIRHWKQNNTIQKDRYKETVCLEEKALLGMDSSKRYDLLVSGKKLDPLCIQSGYSSETQSSVEKSSTEKERVSRVEAQPDNKPTTLDSKTINALIREYSLIDDQYMRIALKSDAKKYGADRLIAALRSASEANENNVMTASFYRTHLYYEPEEEEDIDSLFK